MTRPTHIRALLVTLVCIVGLLLVWAARTGSADTVGAASPMPAGTTARASVTPSPTPARPTASVSAPTSKAVPASKVAASKVAAPKSPAKKAPAKKAPAKKAPAKKAPAKKAPATKAPAKPKADDRWEMVPMPKLDPYNDAIIKNSASSTRTIKVCRDWNATTCSPASPTRSLKPGQSSSRFGWEDTDGYDSGAGWTKQHGCFRCVVTVTAR